MTTDQTPQPGPPAPEPAPLTVSAPPESRLEQLQALYPALKAKSDEAAKALKAVTDAIKLELTALDAEERRFELTARDGVPALRLTYTESWRVDSKRLKAEQPDLYVAYAKQSGSWTLRAGT